MVVLGGLEFLMGEVPLYVRHGAHGILLKSHEQYINCS